MAGLVAGAFAGVLASELGVWSLTRGNPTFWTLVLMTVGAVAGFVGTEMPLFVGDLLLLGVYLTIGLTPAIVGPAHRWIRDDPRPSQPVDAVVVLSSDVTTDTTLGEEGADRLLSGLELMEHGAAPLLVTTRVRKDNAITSDSDQRRLVALAGLQDRWLTVDSVRTTHDEAERITAALPTRQAQHIIVVTSPLHTRRACATFEAVGFTVSCVAARLRSYAVRNPRSAEDRLLVFQAYIYERLGMIKYEMLGWVR